MTVVMLSGNDSESGKRDDLHCPPLVPIPLPPEVLSQEKEIESIYQQLIADARDLPKRGEQQADCRMDRSCAVVLFLCPWALATLPEVALTMSTFVRLAVRDDRERSFEPALLCGRNFREDSLEASHSGVKSRIPVVRTRRDKTAMPHGQ